MINEFPAIRLQVPAAKSLVPAGRLRASAPMHDLFMMLDHFTAGGFLMSLSADRRALHRIPELDWQLPETAAYLRARLAALPCRVFSPCGDAVCAYFDFGAAQTVAFRSDMDALPVTEQTGLPFASQHPGKMHACGHDGHMAMLLALADYVALHKQSRNVLLIFEPAEETTGGAEPICRTGLLETYRVCEIYGLHLWPELPAGVVASRAGGLMSRSCELTAEIAGKSVHIARWRDGCDALEAGMRLISSLYELSEQHACILRFGRMESGTVRNAVSDHTRLEGTLRCLEDAEFFAVRGALDGIAAQIASETGCNITIHCSEGYPPVTNDAALLARARARFPIAEATPTAITEDFSAYQARVPGVFFWLGTGGAPLHSPKFDFDEAVLARGAELYQLLL